MIQSAFVFRYQSWERVYALHHYVDRIDWRRGRSGHGLYLRGGGRR